MGAESVMAPVGLWGKERSSLLTFGVKRRKTEVSTPLLYYRTERVWEGRRFDGRSAAKNVNLPVPLCPSGKSFGIAADAEMTDVLPGVCYWSFIPYIPLIADFIAE